MKSSISSLNTQKEVLFSSVAENSLSAQKPQQANQRQSVSAQSIFKSGMDSITYSSAGKVEPLSSQAAGNAGFEKIM